jgi:hypothetical protein
MVTYKTKALLTIYGLVDWWNHTLTHVLPSSYQREQRMKTGGLVVIPMRKEVAPRLQGLFLYLSEEYVELGRHTKTKIYIWHTSQ